MKLIKTTDAAGHILCHDMTEIVPGKSKGTRFRRGQVLTSADIPVLLDMGKEQLYVWEKQEGMLHEEEGAEILCRLCRGVNLKAAPVREGKIELYAEISGLLKIDSKKIIALNSIGDLAVVTIRGNQGVKEGQKIAALKIIPLLIEEEKLKRAEVLAAGFLAAGASAPVVSAADAKAADALAPDPAGAKPINIIPYKQKKAGLIITGNEIFNKRINETGSGILKKKLELYGAECTEMVILPDDEEKISSAITEMAEKGIGLIICTGGMSVDPDDKTVAAIKKTGAKIVSYGVPFMPGTMLLLGYYEKRGFNAAIVGAPACVFYEHVTALDILLPRLAADDPVSREDLAALGEGGLMTITN